MKLWLAGLALLFCPAVFAQQSVPEIPFDSVPNIPDFNSLPPNLYMGEGSAVTTNSKGHIFVFSRGNTSGPAYAAQASQLLEFGPDGKFIREIGHNLYGFAFAHGVRADKYDNIWTVDKGTDMIVKFNPAGRPTMVFGRRQEASDEGTGPLKHPNPPLPAVDMQFRQPTDVAFDAADNVYISDGYINSRVAKIDKNGVWVKQWGDREARQASSTPRTTSHPTRKATSMWPTAATGASRSSTATEISFGCFRWMCPSIRQFVPSLGTRLPVAL